MWQRDINKPMLLENGTDRLVRSTQGFHNPPVCKSVKCNNSRCACALKIRSTWKRYLFSHKRDLFGFIGQDCQDSHLEQGKQTVMWMVPSDMQGTPSKVVLRWPWAEKMEYRQNTEHPLLLKLKECRTVSRKGVGCRLHLNAVTGFRRLGFPGQ